MWGDDGAKVRLFLVVLTLRGPKPILVIVPEEERAAMGSFRREVTEMANGARSSQRWPGMLGGKKGLEGVIIVVGWSVIIYEM